MLISDTLQLLCSTLLFFLAVGRGTLANVSYVPDTPLILAIMSLGRYVAIFYPLQCPVTWPSDPIWIIALSLWLISCIHLVILSSIRDPAENVLLTMVFCRNVNINSPTIKTLLKAAASVLYFALVAAIILFTS